MKQNDQEIANEIFALVKQGVRHSVIKQTLHIGSSRLYRILKEKGTSVSHISEAWTDTELEILERLYIQSNMTPTEIFNQGHITGRTKAAIATRCNKLAREVKKSLLCPSNSLKAQAQALMAEIPQDTRSKTARVFGNPVFERSALFEKLKERHTIPIRRVA